MSPCRSSSTKLSPCLSTRLGSPARVEVARTYQRSSMRIASSGGVSCFIGGPSDRQGRGALGLQEVAIHAQIVSGHAIRGEMRVEVLAAGGAVEAAELPESLDGLILIRCEPAVDPFLDQLGGR